MRERIPYPSILEQAQAAQFIAKSSLRVPSQGDRFYNPGLIRLPDGRWLMAYRYHSRLKSAASRIALTVLGPGGPGPSQPVLLPLPTGEEHQEDPRLFWHAGA
ncbi:MAG TPA: hypothetical protein VLH09_07165, partial [Bryobacteraceae bacterium]|nr:hypothetical protein [Bryobacteraceae bacterium]